MKLTILDVALIAAVVLLLFSFTRDSEAACVAISNQVYCDGQLQSDLRADFDSPQVWDTQGTYRGKINPDPNSSYSVKDGSATHDYTQPLDLDGWYRPGM
jgi:hypothetical protein